jgi:threonine dehydrogenase-like Zn-dependent dehydrogenase
VKALVVGAEWKPRKNYLLSKDEEIKKRAFVGSQVWCNPNFEIKDVPVPNVDNDEILIRVKACGICGSDIHLYETDDEGFIIFSGLTRLPCILGHEFSGEIVETGRNVSEFKKGDIVTGESIFWCGKCLPCRYGMLNQCQNIELMGLTTDGAFSEYAAVKAKYCWNLNQLEKRFQRRDIFKIGALIEPLGCAYNGLFISGDGFHPGAYTIVYGAGPIGLCSIVLLKATGAGIIIVVDIIDERLQIARKLGADYTFNLKNEDKIVERIIEITDGWGADIQVEAAGAASQTIPIMQRLYSKRGKVIYLGRGDISSSLDINRIVSGANSIIGSRGHSGYGIFPDIIRLIQGEKLKGIMEMITSVFHFQDILRAFSISTNKSDSKILIEFD